MILACSMRGLEVPDPDAVGEQPLVDGLARELHEALVARAAREAGSRPSTPRSAAAAEAFDQLVVGDEVRGGDADPLLRELEQRQEQGRDVARARLRRTADALDHRLTRLGLFGEPVDRCVEEFGIGLDPVVEERGPETVDRRSPNAEVGVAPLVLVASVTVPFVGDADPTREADLLRPRSGPCGGSDGSPSRAAVGAAVGTTGRARRRPPSCRSAVRSTECAPHASSRTRTRSAGSRPLGERLGEAAFRSPHASRRTSGGRSCAAPRRSPRASPGRSRCRSGAPRRGCPPSRGRR